MSDRTVIPGGANETSLDTGGSGPVAELQFAAEDAPLASTVSRLDGGEFELEELTVRDGDRITAVVRVNGVPRPTLERRLGDDPSVGAFETLADFGEEQLLRMVWVENETALVRLLDEGRGVVMDATGGADGWDYRVLFPEHDALGRAMERIEEDGVSVDVRRIYDLESGQNRRYGLTECQAETLLAAFEAGYFQVPRERTLDDVADDLGISHQALSERIRRGHQALVEHTLAGEGTPAEPEE